MKLLLLFVNTLLYLSNTVVQDKTSSVHLQGSIWDAEIGIDLDTKIYGIINSEKIELGFSKVQQLNLEIPTNATELVFETEGYKTLHVPVFFHGPFKKSTQVYFSLQTTKGEGVIEEKNGLIMATQSSSYTGNAIHTFFEFINERFVYKRSISSIVNDTRFSCNISVQKQSSNQFRIFVNVGDEFPMNKRDFRTGEGINIVDVNYYPEESEFESVKTSSEASEERYADIPQKANQSLNLGKIVNEEDTFENVSSVLGLKSIYFEQSKFELTNEAKMVLDEVIAFLKDNENKSISIEGFTDNIGDQSKNIILSQYRAKVVAGYLKQNGINEGRLNLLWQKSIKAEENNTTLNKLRRVEIRSLD
ncbi:Outer membrane protein OmpA [Spirosomataceae bacterium TFI 002]|nr:Outer membrane protein OmpA [Spirosomataceae bacterium TFI 002]